MSELMIAAGVVLYNPEDSNRFIKCLNNICFQVDKVYIFDNSDKENRIKIPPNVIYMSEHSNKGIAYALNRIMEKAEEDGYYWLITIDQDSIISENFVCAYKEAIRSNDQIGIICPQVIDKRRNYMEVKKKPDQEFIDFCITSGSCTSIDAWKKIGKFDEWLFIDLVDNEFCRRLIVSGYRILRLNKLVLNQEFGKIIPKNEREQKLWIWISKILHNKNIAKFSYYKFVNPIRVYYTNRNIIYINKKLKLYGPVGYKDNYNCGGYLGFLISFCIPSFLRAQEKGKVLQAIIKGIRDGRKAEINVWKAQKL